MRLGGWKPSYLGKRLAPLDEHENTNQKSLENLEKSRNSWKVTNPFGNARQEADSTELITSSNKHNFFCITLILRKTTAIDLSHRDDLKTVLFYILCIDGSKVRNSMKILKNRLKIAFAGDEKVFFLGGGNEMHHVDQHEKTHQKSPGNLEKAKKVKKWRTLNCIGCPRIIRTYVFTRISSLWCNRWSSSFQTFLKYTSREIDEWCIVTRSSRDLVP